MTISQRLPTKPILSVSLDKAYIFFLGPSPAGKMKRTSRAKVNLTLNRKDISVVIIVYVISDDNLHKYALSVCAQVNSKEFVFHYNAMIHKAQLGS